MASRGAAYGLTAQVANKIAGKRDPAVEAEILSWIGAIVGERLPAGKIEDVLHDGTVLCKMIQKLVPGSVAKISTRGGKFEHMENINNFLNVCRRVGIPAVDLFQTVDLYENRNIPAVTQCLLALARKCNLQVDSTSSEGGSSSSSSSSRSTAASPTQQKKARPNTQVITTTSSSTSESSDGRTTTSVTTKTTQKTGGGEQAQQAVANSVSSSSGKQQQQKQQQQFQRQDSKSSEARDMSSQREELIQRRQREAAESKARTLQMYDNMAKSGNAGDKRELDINTYRGKDSGRVMLSGSALQKTDLVEETIRERVRASEENKKRLLAAYDYAAKTQPSGTVRDVDLGSFVGVDVSAFETEKITGAATFRSSNGVPSVVKVNSSAPSTPVIDLKKPPSFTQEQPHLDAYERALRQRKQEADERKKRTLAAYDAIARSGVAGPKIVVKEELEHMEIPEDGQREKATKFSSTSSFSGGFART